MNRNAFICGALVALILVTGASFAPVVFRNWVLQHDLDGGGHTISNVGIDATSLLLDGAAVGGGGDTVWTNDGSGWTHPSLVTNRVTIGVTNSSFPANFEVRFSGNNTSDALAEFFYETTGSNFVNHTIFDLRGNDSGS